ncbi:family 43 glycosylhydrolase [Candidatus Obscuribacterales bacterium]|nr:family 43 glycosylhydrolase [Candidatus Obscuribacterales bacterium]
MRLSAINKTLLFTVVLGSLVSSPALAKPKVLEVPTTFCNPMNLDYDFELHTRDKRLNHRSTADPVAFMYKGKYFLFSTNQEGYWWSNNDMATWNFIPHNFKQNASMDDVCAPGAWPTKKGVLFLPCFTEKDTMPLYLSTDLVGNKWTEAVKEFPIQAWDPSFFEDDDGKLYLYWGSSNLYPLYGVELDPNNGYKAIGNRVELLKLDPKKHGWEQFGEDNQNGKMDPFMEGAWVNKVNGKYYLQYGAPGTEWNVYGDGVYVSDKPLGPFKYQEHNPFSWKPTGFARGAGHGSTFTDRFDNLWHVATMVISVKQTFERRLGLFPAGVDKDGVMWANTAFGDYPQTLATGKRDQQKTFKGWTLLSYKKKSWASQHFSDTALAFDEDIKTYWTAPSGDDDQFLAVDLGKPCDVHAIQINYADEAVAFRKKHLGVKHRYQIFQSENGKDWTLLVDKSQNTRDVPHDYVELSEPVRTQFLKLVNLEMPTGHFAVSDLRVFGRAPGAVPANVDNFKVVRDDSDRRNVMLTWDKVPNAYAYEVTFGVKPDKLYSSILVYDTKQALHSLNVDSSYYFKIRAVGETGLGEVSSVSEIR